MKKKTKKSKFESEMTDDDSDSISTASLASSAVSMSRQLSAVSIEDISEALNTSINDIEAKRATSRESGLSKLNRLLANRYLKNEITSSRLQEIIGLLCKSIRRGGKECRLACQTTSLMWITAGENQFFHNVYEVLVLLLKNTDFDSETRSACCSTLALVCWLQDVENSTILSVLVLNDDETEVELLESVLNSFGLLFTMTDDAPTKDYFEQVMDKHLELLDGDSISVRIAAGENLALIMEASELEYDSLRELIRIANDLFNQSSKSVAKKERSVQKSSFRYILESIKEGVVPETELKFGTQSVTFKGWEKLRQLEFLRSAIKEGLSVHFHENPQIQQLFDWTAIEYDKLDKRFLDVTQGKNRAKTLKDQRASKAMARNL